MKETKQAILGFITDHGPIKRRVLFNLMQHYCRVNDLENVTDRKLRLLIAELIQDGEPIASSEKGYSIIQNVEQLRQAVNYLKLKAKTIAIRGNTLIGNYDRCYQDCPANIQFKLF